MSLRDRVVRSGPTGRILAPIMDEIIQKVNGLVKASRGLTAHFEDDTTNAITAPVAGAGNLDSVIEIGAAFKTAYTAHIASTSHHVAADSTNTIASATAQEGVKALADELKVDINAHMSNGTAHTDADDVTDQIDAADVTTKASAITLINQCRAAYEAHRQQEDDAAGTGTVHAAADDTNVVTPTALTADATWAQIAALADAIRTAYEAHRVVTPAVHANADGTNTVSASAVGNVQTVTNTLLNEEKTDFNAHIVLAASHQIVNDAMAVGVANATTLATSRTLANALRESYNDHITSADEPSDSLLRLLDRRP